MHGYLSKEVLSVPELPVDTSQHRTMYPHTGDEPSSRQERMTGTLYRSLQADEL